MTRGRLGEGLNRWRGHDCTPVVAQVALLNRKYDDNGPVSSHTLSRTRAPSYSGFIKTSRSSLSGPETDSRSGFFHKSCFIDCFSRDGEVRHGR